MASYFDKNKDGKITKEGKSKTKTYLYTYSQYLLNLIFLRLSPASEQQKQARNIPKNSRQHYFPNFRQKW